VSIKVHEADSGVAQAPVAITQQPRAEVIRAWTPWVILTVFVFVWGFPVIKTFFNGILAPEFPMAGWHLMVEKVAPVVSKPTKEGAIYVLNLLSATGIGILFAAIVGGITMKYRVGRLVTESGRTIWLVRYSLLTIVLMLGLGTLTGSDTASNVLFGGMQKVAVEQLGLSPNLMDAANSSGGVMGKMIDAQSIVVASTATGRFDHEGDILRYVFFHSIALACLSS